MQDWESVSHSPVASAYNYNDFKKWNSGFWVSLPFIFNTRVLGFISLCHNVFSAGCNDHAGFPPTFTMALSSDEPICPKFQPNIFDPSRCHDCLRQRHLHAGVGGNTEGTPLHRSTADSESRAKSFPDAVTESGKGAALTPIPSQAEERDTSSKVRERGEEEVGGIGRDGPEVGTGVEEEDAE